MFSPAPFWPRQLLHACRRRGVLGQVRAEAVEEGASNVRHDSSDRQVTLLAPVPFEFRICLCQDSDEITKGIGVLHREEEQLDPPLFVLATHQGVPDHHLIGHQMSHGKGGSQENVGAILNGSPTYEVGQSREVGRDHSAWVFNSDFSFVAELFLTADNNRTLWIAFSLPGSRRSYRYK